MIILQDRSFWNLDAGNLVLLGGLFIQGMAFYRVQQRHHIENATQMTKMHEENKQRISQVIEWKREHQREADARDAAISELKVIAAEVKANTQATKEALLFVQQQLLRRRDDRKGT